MNTPTTPQAAQVLPCPFCGSPDVKHVDRDECLFVMCEGCGAAMDALNTDGFDVVSAWNRRAALEAQKAEQGHIALIGPVCQLLWSGVDPVADIMSRNGLKVGDKLYAHPAQPQAQKAAAPELVALTDEQIDALWQDDELSMPNKIRRRIVASEAIALFCRINNLPTGTASDGGEW
jgi:Lar family restriction alleviation protein